MCVNEHAPHFYILVYVSYRLFISIIDKVRRRHVPLLNPVSQDTHVNRDPIILIMAGPRNRSLFIG